MRSSTLAPLHGRIGLQEFMRLSMLCGALLLGLLLGLGAWPPAAFADTPAVTVPFEGSAVSFRYPAALLGEPVAATVPACPLDDPSDIPDGVSPEHAAVVFKTGAALPVDTFRECNLPNFKRPELRVLPIAPFVAVYPQAADALAELRAVLAAGHLKAGAQVPFVPFVDAHTAFAEHVTFQRFQNGSGFGFLTQWMIEPDSIGTALVYVFQGVTADGKTYVLGTVPVHAMRPLEPFPLRRTEPFEQTQVRYVPYEAKIADEMRGAGDADFTPDLASLRALFSSLTVK